MNGIVSDAGEYRRHGVRIMTSRVTVANYAKVPALIDELTRYAPPLPVNIAATLAISHAQFEKIHPFSDGNGRVGRLLMLAQALQAGMTPPLVLKERKHAYYKYLELAQTKEQFASLEFFVTEAIAEAHELLFG